MWNRRHFGIKALGTAQKNNLFAVPPFGGLLLLQASFSPVQCRWHFVFYEELSRREKFREEKKDTYTKGENVKALFAANKIVQALQGAAEPILGEHKRSFSLFLRNRVNAFQADTTALLFLNAVSTSLYSPGFFPKSSLMSSTFVRPSKRRKGRGKTLRRHLQNWTRLEVFLIHPLRLTDFQNFCVAQVLKFAFELIQRTRLCGQCSHYLLFHHLHYLWRKRGKKDVSSGGIALSLGTWSTTSIAETAHDLVVFLTHPDTIFTLQMKPATFLLCHIGSDRYRCSFLSNKYTVLSVL